MNRHFSMTSRLVTGDVRERPILFSGEMVRALLSGAKTQTRRVCKPVRGFDHYNIMKHGMPYAADSCAVWWHGPDTDRVGCLQDCPYGKPGDRLYVRETHAETECDGGPCMAYKAGGDVQMIGATGDKREGTWVESLLGPGGPDYYDVDRWRPSIHMPRWASRITLEITDVRVERLQAISEADAIAEGCDSHPQLSDSHWRHYPGGWTREPIDSFASLWNSINGPGSWEANPYVLAISFNRIKE